MESTLGKVFTIFVFCINATNERPLSAETKDNIPVDIVSTKRRFKSNIYLTSEMRNREEEGRSKGDEEMTRGNIGNRSNDSVSNRPKKCKYKK